MESYQPIRVVYVREAQAKAEFISAKAQAERSFGGLVRQSDIIKRGIKQYGSNFHTQNAQSKCGT
ncbi:hypothetical protein CQA49_09530 [Helicobacter sp. MIT 00-7814]|nr:hypothetical protein CQA49_09530 [Helicobacter sp. MIT 00-7814]RDU53889.1 hypothetical protein CQA37_06590 [Helicobacter sp. MIT 99-10781]